MRASEQVRLCGGRLLGVVLGLLVPAWTTAAEPPSKAEGKAPWQRRLQGDEAKHADQLQVRIDERVEEGKYAEAIAAAKELLALREGLQGTEHWEAANARQQLKILERWVAFSAAQQADYRRGLTAAGKAQDLETKGHYAQAQPLREEALALDRQLLGEEHPYTARNYHNLAYNLQAQGKYAEAEVGFRKALALKRQLQGEEHPDTAASYNSLAANLQAQGQYAEAERGFRKALALSRQLQGEEHPNTANCYNNLATNLQAQGKYAEADEGFRKVLTLTRRLLGEEHPDTARSYNNLATNLQARGKYAEAEEGFRKALALRRQLLGEEHPKTARSYAGLAGNLQAQGKYAEADEGFRTALTLTRKLLGEDHPDTAASYNDLAYNLQAQGKYAEADEGFRTALALRRKLLGENHPSTAQSYNNLAGILQAMGKYAEAEEGYRKALALNRQLLGEEHPGTATSYNNLAGVLQAQGKYAEAEEGFRKALALHRRLLGEEHPLTANSYNNLAANLAAQGRHAEAEEAFRKALALRRKLLGEEHPDTARSYGTLAYNLNAQGKYAEAEEGFRKTLALRRKLLGEEHPDTARGYNNLAYNLQAQGKYAEAEEGFRKTLALRRKLLGEDHLDTATSYSGLAYSLAAQGFLREAEEQLEHAADVFAHARPRSATSGLERATATGQVSPLPFLAVLLARHGQPERAWRRFEQSRGRGTWDDLQARLAHSPAEHTRLAEVARQLERLDQLFERYGALKQPTEEQARQHKDWLTERRQTQGQLDTVTRELARKYGLGDTQAAALAQVQAALPGDTALLGWVDLRGTGKAAGVVNERWAVLLRAKGPPAWVALKGSGKGDAWTEADDRFPRELATALHSRPQPEQADWRPLARRLYRQRLEPLEPHLGATTDLPAVRHLVVLPSMMDGFPLEVLTDRYTFSSAPSATVFAFLRGKARPQTSGLLALADPVFDRPDATARPAPLPPAGVLLTAVVPGSNGARAGLHAGDVLLRYRGSSLTTLADLQTQFQVPVTDPKARLSVKVWRAGETLPVEVLPGPLGVSVAREPAPEALARRRRIEADLVASRGDGSPKALPGTRVEVAALARRFHEARQPLTLLTDSDASEQRLAELAADGSLGKVRYLHLATHGTVNWDFHLQSALLLARDRLPDPGQQLDAGRPVYTGRLTAAAVLRDWNLDADLVTLSACETGLGHYAYGEGYLGFAQALLLVGSRSVCLSLWQVDDAATALLMDRFYANLLGQREGLTKGMGKAAALAEAKVWLRTLPRAEAVQRAAALTGGVERGAGRPALPRAPAVPETATADEPPYAHPYYWAAFVLVGDPA